MNTNDLIAGYAAYTDAAELGDLQSDAPAITPTTPVPTPSPVSVELTVDWGC